MKLQDFNQMLVETGFLEIEKEITAEEIVGELNE